VASDATFQWDGGTGSASSASNWTLQPGGVANTPNIPQSDDSIVMASGDAQFTDMPIPGQDNGTHGGVVFWQGGEIDMINSESAGGTAAVLSNTFVQLTNSVAAVGTLTSQGTANNSGTIDSDTNGVMTLTVTSGVLSNLGTIEALNNGSIAIGTNTGASFNNDGGSVLANGGSISMTGSLAGTAGYWAMTNGGTIEVNAPVTSNVTRFDFTDGTNTWLHLDQVATFKGDVFEFGSGNTVDLGAISVGTIVVASTGAADGTDTLTLENAGGTPIDTFDMTPFSPSSPFTTGTFAVAPGGNAGDFQFTPGAGSDEVMTTAGAVVACFMAGTRLATDHGEVAVEDLQVGDCVKTTLGGKLEPIVWIGHRTIDCSRHPKPKQVWPVRIAAGAFGRGRPSRDLWLSPDHAVYVEGVLIPVKYLINGSSIAQVPRVSVSYYHIELRRHDVVLANGLTAESYLAGADGTIFANNGGPVALHPDMSSRVWEAEGCAPLLVTGSALETARRQIRLPGRTTPARRRARAA
jgi:Hint domain